MEKLVDKIITMNNNLAEEAEAFNKRINERVDAGFVPDLKNAVKCDYFYKSIFRDPYYMNLYFEKSIHFYSKHFNNHFSKKQLNILDVGCGPGIVTLELARLGHNVIGIDIANDAIKAAQETADKFYNNSLGGTLKYEVLPLIEVQGNYDVILFSGVLHHLEDLKGSILKINQLLNTNGLLICQEPYHQKFNKGDAALVGMFRALLAITGNWYDDSLRTLSTAADIDSLSNDILTEYRLERDKHETEGQSPNDLSHDGQAILEELKTNFEEIETIPYFSFIYRFLGGIRGEEKACYQLAKLLTEFDNYATLNNIMNPNYFLFCGQKR
jgi:SAM-dependent methyltransferase